jgi:hypothetical protein
MPEVRYRDESEDAKKSLQYKQPTCCDGQSTGFQCKHFWHMVIPIDVHNSTVVGSGEKTRLCTLIDTADGMRLQGESRPEMAAYCNRYEASRRRYDPSFEEYAPLTQEQIDDIENGRPVEIKQFKVPPVHPLKRFLFKILP